MMQYLGWNGSRGYSGFYPGKNLALLYQHSTFFFLVFWKAATAHSVENDFLILNEYLIFSFSFEK